MNAKILECTFAEYLSDPCEQPSLDASTAALLINSSPHHAWTFHPKLGGLKRPVTKDLENGSLYHSLLLNSGKDYRVVSPKTKKGAPSDSWQTAEAKELRDQIRAQGLIPILESELNEAREITEILKRKMEQRNISFPNPEHAELMVEWTEYSDAGVPVQCRASIDYYDVDRNFIYELKKIKRANQRTCEQSAVGYGYDIQRAAYIRAIHALVGGDMPPGFGWVFYELNAPWSVSPAIASPSMIELGEMKWRRAINEWAKCLEQGIWPEYASVDEVLYLEAPTYSMAEEVKEQFEEEEEDEVTGHPI